MTPASSWIGILVASLSAFVLGGIWYSPNVFGKAWIKHNNFSAGHLESRKMGLVFGLSYFLELIGAINLNFFLGPQSSVAFGAIAGALVGVWIIVGIGVTYLFERKSFVLFMINSGYHLVAFTIMGLILAQKW